MCVCVYIYICVCVCVCVCIIFDSPVSNNNLQYRTGKFTQYCVITCIGKESEKEHIHITESFSCTPKTNTALYINYTSIKLF